jgi:hypothetical protein
VHVGRLDYACVKLAGHVAGAIYSHGPSIPFLNLPLSHLSRFGL